MPQVIFPRSDNGQFFEALCDDGKAMMGLYDPDQEAIRVVMAGAPAAAAPHPGYKTARAFTASGDGPVVDCSAFPARFFSLQVVTTGALVALDAKVVGSLDGVNFNVDLVGQSGLVAAKIVTTDGTPRPVTHFRLRCAMTGAGTATLTALGVG